MDSPRLASRPLIVFACSALLASLVGCNDILGIGEPVHGGAGGASTTSTGGKGGGSTSSTGGAGGEPVYPCDPNDAPSDGVFVSAQSGDDDSGSGTPTLPVKTIGRALEIATAEQRRAIHLDQGTYAEEVAIFSLSGEGDFVIDGGWTASGAVWARDCSPEARGKTVIASPTERGLSASVPAQVPLILRTLTIASKSQGASSAGADGESCYGVSVEGTGGTLVLTNVAVQAGKAGRGGDVSAQVDGAEAVCDPDGVSSCAAIPQGQSGSTGPKGDDGEPAGDGTFADKGYQPASGTDGIPGDPGQNGGPGADGETAMCYGDGCSGAPVPPCNTGFCGNLVGLHNVTAGHGMCGCGGRGGSAGAKGRGGGASVALLAKGDLTVVASYTVLTAGDGGDGSVGAGGLAGLAGTAGAKGGNTSCPGGCASVSIPNNQCQCQQPGTSTLMGGGKGGDGGAGGLGGKGGGGSGGPSVGVVRVGEATVALDANSSIKVGSGGLGADGAKMGGSFPELTVP